MSCHHPFGSKCYCVQSIIFGSYTLSLHHRLQLYIFFVIFKVIETEAISSPFTVIANVTTTPSFSILVVVFVIIVSQLFIVSASYYPFTVLFVL